MFRNTLICLNTLRQKTIKREKAKIEDKEKINFATKSVGTRKGILSVAWTEDSPSFKQQEVNSTWLSHKQHLGLPH